MSAGQVYDVRAYLRGEIDADGSEGGGWIVRASFYDVYGVSLSTVNAALSATLSLRYATGL